MLFHCLCVLLLSWGTYSALLFIPQDDISSHFIVYDVSAHKGSTGNLKTAFNHLKNIEYAVKIIGEERAIFVVRDDGDCGNLQSDFQGLKVEALSAEVSTTPVTFNETGLVVMVIESSLEPNALNQAFDEALSECGNCFKIIAVIGGKPQKCILIGNIPLDQINDITNSTTTDKCCDTVSTRRAIDFNTFHKKHQTGCIDFHATPVHKVDFKPIPLPDHKPTHLPAHKPVTFPDHKPTHLPVHQPVPFPDHKPTHLPAHKPVPFPDQKPTHLPSHRSFPGHPFVDHIRSEATSDEHVPIDPRKGQGFPRHELPTHGIEDPHFNRFRFPDLNRNAGYRPSHFGPHFQFDSRGSSSPVGYA